MSLLPKEILDRCKLVEDKNIDTTFFIAGEKHICRFCQTPIAQLIEDILIPLPNKGHAYLELASEAYYRFNGCQDCLRLLDFDDEDFIEAIYCSDLIVWANIAEREKQPPGQFRKTMAARFADTVKPGRKGLETSNQSLLNMLSKRAKQIEEKIKKNKEKDKKPK